MIRLCGGCFAGLFLLGWTAVLFAAQLPSAAVVVGFVALFVLASGGKRL